MMGRKADAIHLSQYGTVSTLGSKKNQSPSFIGRKMSFMPLGSGNDMKTGKYGLEHVRNAAAVAAGDNQVPMYGAAALLRGNEASIMNFNGVTNQGNVTQSRYRSQTAERPVKKLRASNRAQGRSSRYYTYNRLIGDDWGNV